MTMKLSDRQAKALERHVKAGRFATIEQAVEAAITQLDTLFDDPCDWALPHLAEADSDIAARRVSSWDDTRKAMTAAARGAAKP